MLESAQSTIKLSEVMPSAMSDRELLESIYIEIRNLRVYVESLDEKAKAMADPAKMQEMMSQLFSGLM